MQGGQLAIKLTANAQHWTWELIDSEGMTTAKGVADDQDAAMESAWRAARSKVEPDEFPQIAVGYD